MSNMSLSGDISERSEMSVENKPLVLKLVLALCTTAGEKHAAHLGYFAGQAAATEKPEAK